ncbi:hypothetical protein IV54_GL001612 [Levilactobacillus paucivorans]|uniref:DNA alkylation repair enzyme n=1 Tax=Levilactobacillus paucivorans TaxID=616990 RepID=A0A0R2LQQ8_9LACO|nr:DNA alkylation repair protein [Levilactobacillus paucivorans]KRO04094.1 hypothetical protein IV54_GL001612 [Levilactobacillus paucivorans]
MDLTATQWTPASYTEFLTFLESKRNEKAQARATKIVRTNYPLLGISMADLKAWGTAISKGDPMGFLAVAGTEVYEVILVRAYVISRLRLNLPDFVAACDRYFATADCWAICDMAIHFKQVKRYPAEFLATIDRYLQSGQPWLQRSGLVFLLKFYLTPDFRDQAFTRVLSVTSDDYYVQLGQAWFLATAFKDDPDRIYQILETLPVPLVQRTVQKIKSLSRTTPDQKRVLTGILARRRAE